MNEQQQADALGVSVEVLREAKQIARGGRRQMTQVDIDAASFRVLQRAAEAARKREALEREERLRRVEERMDRLREIGVLNLNQRDVSGTEFFKIIAREFGLTNHDVFQIWHGYPPSWGAAA